jgi:hypothetical protein
VEKIFGLGSRDEVINKKDKEDVYWDEIVKEGKVNTPWKDVVD